MKKTIILLMLIFVCSLTAEQYIIRINANGAKNTELTKLFNSRGEDIAARGIDYIDLVINKEKMPEYEQYKPKIIFDHDPVTPLRAKGNLGAYHTYYEMLTEMQELAAQNPNIMKIINLGPAWEKANGVSGADRDMIVIKISDNVETDEDEPQILLDADHHAREIITPEIIITVAKKLVEGYNNNDPEMKYYVTEREIYLIPIVNPDGHNYVANVDGMWRKNRHKYGSYYGADLNRNYGYKWGYDNYGSSNSPSDITYRGSAPFSEPETALIRDFVSNKNFVFNISYHSYSNLILFPWGYDYTVDNPDRAVYQQLADSMSAINGYATGAPGELLYDANGGSFDWYYGDDTKPVTLAFSPEVGGYNDGFAPPESRIESLVNENLPNCFFLIRQADDPYLKRPKLQSNSLSTSYLAGPFHTELTFAVSAELDSVYLNYMPVWESNYSAIKLHKSSSYQFSSDPIELTQENTVNYYYTAYLTYKNKKFKFTYPQLAKQQPMEFNYHFTDDITQNNSIPNKNSISTYPNPFNSTTRISMDIAEDQEISIILYDVSGRVVKKIVENHNMTVGRHNFDLNISLSGGIYFIKVSGEKMQPLLQKINYLK